MLLSPHFELLEFERTRAPMPNEAPIAHRDNLVKLCHLLLEPWRKRSGRLYVTSGYRTEAVNAWLAANNFKASKTSEHMRGLAADIRPLDTRIPVAWMQLLELVDLPIGQAIVYVREPGKGWIHVSVDLELPIRRDIRVDVPWSKNTIPWKHYQGNPLEVVV